VADGLLQVLGAVPPYAIGVCEAQVVLSGGPVLWMVCAGTDLQGLLKVADGLLQVLGATPPYAIGVGKTEAVAKACPLGRVSVACEHL
jgi:hypothetical protein